MVSGVRIRSERESLPGGGDPAAARDVPARTPFPRAGGAGHVLAGGRGEAPALDSRDRRAVPGRHPARGGCDDRRPVRGAGLRARSDFCASQADRVPPAARRAPNSPDTDRGVHPGLDQGRVPAEFYAEILLAVLTGLADPAGRWAVVRPRMRLGGRVSHARSAAMAKITSARDRYGRGAWLAGGHADRPAEMTGAQ